MTNYSYTNGCINLYIFLIEFGQLRYKGPDILEVYYDGIWRDVCYDRWDIADTSVACRQLGYRGSEEEPFFYYSYSFNALAWINDIACFGNESRLVDCPHHIGMYCNAIRLSRANCIAGILTLQIGDVNRMYENSLMYLDGCESFAPSAESFPQVVRYYDTAWYYLSEEGFTKENADVVCRENGGTTSMMTGSMSIFNIEESLPILPMTFECVGNEFSLCDCPSSESEYESSQYVVEIQCTLPSKYNCNYPISQPFLLINNYFLKTTEIYD